MGEKKRVKMTCWNPDCGREYSLLREFKGQPLLFVKCPFCMKEGVVDLAPWRSKLWEITQGEGGYMLETLDLPDVLPTRKPKEEDEQEQE